ncbi:YihY/virulence factor BrkB family protein [bacterium 1xD8-48]|jgi:membrane protein|nr:YihY/virulence factor BrkB family protein [Lachnospiraceae bacterium]MCI9326166.1 YihY/virulence factor BrkB family protein [Lachnospiraceae bacterium]NBJ99166.1 YihY/virulence factor BrkB family protein [bacterium 1xD8-48]
MLRRLLFIGYDFGKHMSKKNISAFAASTAFFLFLSLIPALMLLCAILPYTPVTKANLMYLAREITPDAMDALLVSIISDVYDKSVGIISVTVAATLWSAGKGVLALMRGLNAINDVEENRNYLLLRIVASLYLILMIFAVLLSLLIMVFGNSLIRLIEGFVPQTSYLFDILIHFRTPLVWAVLTVIIALMYAYVPGTRQGFKIQLPGAVFAAVAWSIMTWAFSLYVDEFNGFTMYGNLTTIIILMLWLYAAMYIILAGAFINRYFKPAFQFFIGKKHTDRKRNGG